MKNQEHNPDDIDKYRLDEEAEYQPRRHRELTDLYAAAKRDHALAKKDLEKTEARIKMKIRSDPSHYGLEKVTDEGLKNAMVLTKEYEEAKKAEIIAEYQMDLTQGRVRASDHRRGSIDNLVKLFLNDYYAEPRLDRDGQAYVGKKQTDRAFGPRKGGA